jgi:hypothetical protein
MTNDYILKMSIFFKYGARAFKRLLKFVDKLLPILVDAATKFKQQQTIFAA